MKIHKGFKFRIYPTKEQKRSLLQCGGNARFLWNYVLNLNQDHYKESGKFKFYHELSSLLPELKKVFPFLKLSYSQSLQTVLRNFERSLKESSEKKGFPKFKKKLLLNDSFAYPQGWRSNKGFVKIPKIGEVRWRKHRNLQGKPKSITVSQDGSNWYCSVTCEIKIPEKEMKTENIIGCDVGLKEFLTLSDGTVIPNPRHLNRYKDKLTKAQRRLNKKQKGSRNRFKQRLKVRKLHNKIRDIRKDFLHKLSNSIAKIYDGIVVEDLNIKGMMNNHKLARSISDVSWSEFFRQLKYKCKWLFKHFIKIDRWYPSSKTCSSCGLVKEMPLDKRIFNCPDCGISIDRDLNASINIRNLGLNTLGHRGINACGDDSLESSRKQEKEGLDN